ncbi:hypothetical protein NLG97_g5953 [Lecanicillium saksenae]|uniref:Uncharacterized protein n=1 Tax=Lecanicillium saksenae TaxID=468837 RepID=A0ACC1QRK6_9HYPO|nr:hypothetical protein NLG97_g5953 [Lecanicillium saksenae]
MRVAVATIFLAFLANGAMAVAPAGDEQAEKRDALAEQLNFWPRQGSSDSQSDGLDIDIGADSIDVRVGLGQDPPTDDD